MIRLVLWSLFIFYATSKATTQSSSIVTSIIVDDNNVSGGGFQSDVTITDDGLTVYSAADVSGIFKSTDGGLSYKTINQGLESPKVATLAITPDNDQILYAGTGDKGNTGGLFRSIDGGNSWQITLEGRQAKFSGNQTDAMDSLTVGGHPRSNGDLIAVVTGPDSDSFLDDIVIAGTYKEGVKIFISGGEEEVTFPEHLNTAGFVRSVAYNPSIPNTAFIAVQFNDEMYENGIYQIDFSDINAISSEFAFETENPEGLVVLSSGRVYGAVGEAGIVRYTGTQWVSINNNLDDPAVGRLNRKWTSITGYVKQNANSTSDIVYACVNNRIGELAGSNFSSVWRTRNGGQVWEPLADDLSSISHQIYGQPYDWWYSTDAFQNASLGKGNNVISSIEVARGPFPNGVADDIIYLSGRGGIWRSADGGDNWNPAVYNMQATANNDVAVNPNNSKQIAIANTDYVVLETSDRFRNGNISRDRPENSASRGYDVIFDSKANEIILGVGKRDDNEGGEVYKKSALSLGTNSPWVNTNLNSTISNEGRVRAITYGYHDGSDPSDAVTILAVVENKGVYRYHNGVWQQSTDTGTGLGLTINKTERSNFIWPDNLNSGVVYLLDLSTGFFRSNDGGQSWTNIWPCMAFRNNDFFNTGYITASDHDPTTLYVSMQSDETSSCIGRSFKVFRMEDADEGFFGDPDTDDDILDISYHTNNTKIKRPGPIAIGHNGKLWLTEQQDSKNGISAGLFVIEDPQNDMTFTEVTTEDYRDLVIQPSGMDVSSDGYVYIAQNGMGLAKIKYTDTANIGLSDACIEIYPDPTNSIFTISGDLSMYDIEIIDGNGDVHSPVDNAGTTVCIDVSDLPLGTFLIRASHIMTDELIIQKILKF